MQASNPYDAPEHSAMPPTSTTGIRNLRVKSVDVMTVGKLMGALYALIGLIAGVLMAIFTLGGVMIAGDGIVPGLVTSLGMIIMLPVFYGFVGFVGGLIGGLLYNLVAGFVGGVVLEVEV